MEYWNNFKFWENEPNNVDPTKADQSNLDKTGFQHSQPSLMAMSLPLPKLHPPLPPTLPKTNDKCCTKMTTKSEIIIGLGVLAFTSVVAALVIFFVDQSGQAHFSSYKIPPSSTSDSLRTPSQRHLENQYQPRVGYSGNWNAHNSNPIPPRVQMGPTESHRDNSLRLFRRFEFSSSDINDKIVFY